MIIKIIEKIGHGRTINHLFKILIKIINLTQIHINTLINNIPYPIKILLNPPENMYHFFLMFRYNIFHIPINIIIPKKGVGD
jgi:hypothetical protein